MSDRALGQGGASVAWGQRGLVGGADHSGSRRKDAPEGKLGNSPLSPACDGEPGSGELSPSTRSTQEQGGGQVLKNGWIFYRISGFASTAR